MRGAEKARMAAVKTMKRIGQFKFAESDSSAFICIANGAADKAYRKRPRHASITKTNEPFEARASPALVLHSGRLPKSFSPRNN
jgi:hypothetical protein